VNHSQYLNQELKKYLHVSSGCIVLETPQGSRRLVKPGYTGKLPETVRDLADNELLDKISGREVKVPERELRSLNYPANR